MEKRQTRTVEAFGSRRLATFLAFLVATTMLAVAPSPVKGQSTNANVDPAGTWKGELGSGAAKLHVVLTLTKSGSGEFVGQLNSLDQGITLPMENIRLTDNAVHFEVKAVGGVYDGKLNAARTEIAGTWTQAGVAAQRLNFARSEQQTATKDKIVPDGPKEKPALMRLNVAVPIAPTAFKADGKWHLVYELHLSNMDRWNYELVKVEAISGDAAKHSLVTYTGSGLEAVMRRPGQPNATEKAKLEPGMIGIVYMWASVASLEVVPATMRQRLTVKVGTFPEEMTIETEPIEVGRGTIIVSPPLRGDHWLAGNGPSNVSTHRQDLIPIDGHAAIAERFAIDWVRLGDGGETFQGDAKDNRNYYAYRAEVLAVADGVVTEVMDGIPENVPGVNSRAVPITLETIGGNHVILDLGGGHFAFYAHLQPGSLRVKLGEKVRRGQVIGFLGNSGNSTQPHLHFHVENRNSPLGAEGLPYALASFEVIGYFPDWKPSDAKGSMQMHRNEIPTENEVVNFPADSP